jgi:hypothetical protein
MGDEKSDMKNGKWSFFLRDPYSPPSVLPRAQPLAILQPFPSRSRSDQQ